MHHARPNLAAMTFALVLLALVSGHASGASDDTSPRVTWTERRPVSPPCDPAGPGWFRIYGQDTRGDGRSYQSASVTLPDSAAAYQGALRRARNGLANGIRARIQPVLYSCMEQWPRIPNRASNKALADSALSQVDRMVAGMASVWKSGDCPQTNDAGVVQHIAFVVVGTDLDELIDATWSTIETRLVMPRRTDGKSDSEVFRERVLDALGVQTGGGREAELERAAQAERAAEEKRIADSNRRAVEEIRAQEERATEEVRLAEAERLATKERQVRQQQLADSIEAAAAQRRAMASRMPKVRAPEWRRRSLRIECTGGAGIASVTKFKHPDPSDYGDYSMQLPYFGGEAGVQVSLGLGSGWRLATEMAYATRGDGPLTVHSRDYRATLQWAGESTVTESGAYCYLLGGPDRMDIVTATLDPAGYGQSGPRVSVLDYVRRRARGWHVGVGVAGRTSGGWHLSCELEFARMVTKLFKTEGTGGVIQAWTLRMGIGR